MLHVYRCFAFRDSGTCDRGDTCRFDHFKTDAVEISFSVAEKMTTDENTNDSEDTHNGDNEEKATETQT
jgi:hypothetical protein